jgi:hypothetical protein
MTFNPFGKPPTPAGGSANVTSHNQSGGITAHTVNVAKPPARQLDAQAVALYNRIPLGAQVVITAVLNDVEAYSFAKQIFDHLGGARPDLKLDGVKQGVFTPPVQGTQVNLNQHKGGPVEILVGGNNG